MSGSPSERPVPSRGTNRATPVMSGLRLVIVGMATGIVLFAVAFAIILPFTAPPVLAVLALLVVGAVAHLAIERIGYLAAPLDRGLPPAEATAGAAATFQNRLMIRAIMAEAPALIGVILAFVVTPRSSVTYLVGAAVSLVLVARHAWPSRRSVDRVAASLEAEGADSGLYAALGLPPHPDGPVVEH